MGYFEDKKQKEVEQINETRKLAESMAVAVGELLKKMNVKCSLVEMGYVEEHSLELPHRTSVTFGVNMSGSSFPRSPTGKIDVFFNPRYMYEVRRSTITVDPDRDPQKIADWIMTRQAKVDATVKRLSEKNNKHEPLLNKIKELEERCNDFVSVRGSREANEAYINVGLKTPEELEKMFNFAMQLVKDRQNA